MVAISVAALSALPELQGVMSVAFVCLFLLALWLVVRFTAAEDGTLQLTRRSASAWLACALLGAAVFASSPPDSLGLLILRSLSAVALVEALTWGARNRSGLVPSSGQPGS
ncbi:MAG: hypothetical protein ACT4PU_11655 [Planctomycetota bacterium]